MTGGESSQVLARFEHAVPLAREIVWASLACDAVGNAARNDQCLGMREHARLGQHQWHVRLPATGKWNCRYVADGVNIFIPVASVALSTGTHPPWLASPASRTTRGLRCGGT